MGRRLSFCVGEHLACTKPIWGNCEFSHLDASLWNTHFISIIFFPLCWCCFFVFFGGGGGVLVGFSFVMFPRALFFHVCPVWFLCAALVVLRVGPLCLPISSLSHWCLVQVFLVVSSLWLPFSSWLSLLVFALCLCPCSSHVMLSHFPKCSFRYLTLCCFGLLLG